MCYNNTWKMAVAEAILMDLRVDTEGRKGSEYQADVWRIMNILLDAAVRSKPDIVQA